MCRCLWIEYSCGCWRRDCAHTDPAGRHHHPNDSVWRGEHRAWQYCPVFLIQAEAATEAATEAAAAAAAAAASDSDSASDDGSIASTTTGVSGAIEVPTVQSADPRHGGRVPLCGDVRYETWRMDKLCPACRDDLAGARGPQ